MALALNRAILMGRLTKDPEVRQVGEGNTMAKFSIKISEPGNDGTIRDEYQRVVVFGKSAEAIGKFLKEGSPIYVDGQIRSRSWEGEDGRKKSMTEVAASEVQFFPKDYDPDAIVGMNKVMLMGNLTGDPSFGQAGNGVAHNSFSLAINENRGKKEHTEWVKAIAFGQTALDTSDLLKGAPLFVEGKLRTRGREVEGGTKEYSTDIVVENATRLTFPAAQMDHDSAPGR